MIQHPILHTLRLAVLVSVLIGVAPQAFSANVIQWFSYEEGMALGKSEGKKAFISFYANWCQYCRAMDNQTFKDPAVVSFLNENFITIKVDVDREKHIAAQYNINPLPDTWFLTANGDIIGNRPGFMTAEELMPMLQFIHTESYLKMSYAEFKEKLSNDMQN